MNFYKRFKKINNMYIIKNISPLQIIIKFILMLVNEIFIDIRLK